MQAKVSTLSRKIIEIKEVWKTYTLYEVKVDALRGINLTIHEGQFVVILGPSGSGKTTLLNLVGGLDKPTKGEIWVNEKPIHQLNEKHLTEYRKHDVGFVFQFFNLLSSLTALENVEYALELVGIPTKDSNKRDFDPKKIKEKALQALRSVGIEDHADKFPSQLSGGQQQRVAIARAIVKDPKVLLCDEPTGSLDYETGIQVLSVLHSIARSNHRTVLLVTHNTEIARMADRVVKLRSGQVIEDYINESPVKPEELVW